MSRWDSQVGITVPEAVVLRQMYNGSCAYCFRPLENHVYGECLVYPLSEDTTPTPTPTLTTRSTTRDTAAWIYARHGTSPTPTLTMRSTTVRIAWADDSTTL